MKKLPWLLCASLAGSACVPSVYVRGMSAASVDIPTDVQRVAVVDRSSPKNAGQSALGAIEGVLTGEGLFEDNQGRDVAIDALVRTLEEAPRFEVIRPAVTPTEVASNLMDKPWTYKAVVKLCEEHGCDAVIALETFDTDATVTSGQLEVSTSAEASPEAAPATAEEGTASRESVEQATAGTEARAVSGPGPGMVERAADSSRGPDGADLVPQQAPAGTQRSSTMSRDGGAPPAPDASTEAPDTDATSEDAAGGGTLSREPSQTEASEAAPGEPATAPGTDASGEPVMTHWAQRETRISATWRIYDAGADAVLDEQRDRVMGSRSRVEGASLEAALAKLATAESMISRDGRKLGMEYARRISPVYVTLERSYFGGGMTFGRPPGSLKEGRIYVKAGDWDGAAEIYKSIVDDPASSMKQRGKARHNLAIAAEIKGQLRKAHKLAQKAAVENNTGRSRAYARSLERRVAEQVRLEAQLAPPEDDE